MSPTPEALLAHAEWVRSLARCMVADAELAEDLAQDAWVSALRSPPAQVLNMRSWLAQTLRNLVRQNHRAAGRRDRRERAAARPERVPAAADVVERASSHRSVVETVLELDEPYRTAVLLRFFEGMPPRRIAQRLEVPVSTVHTRIQRGLKMLRGRLDRQHGGDRKAWLLSVLPLADKGGPSAALVGALLMKTKLIISGALVVAIGLVAAWPLLMRSGEPAPVGNAVPVADQAVSGETAGDPAPQQVVTRQPVTATPVTAKAAEPAAPPIVEIRGRLVASDAGPLPGMAVRFESGEQGPTTTTGAMGAFQIVTEPAAGQIVIDQEGWTTVMAAVVNSGRPPDHALVVAARAIDLAGRVVDEFGSPIPGAEIELELPEGFRTRFTENTDASSNRGWRTEAADDGSFGLPEVATISGAVLVAGSPGYDDHRRPTPQEDTELEIVLRRTARAAGTVSGQVIDDRGAVVEGAWVAVGGSSTRTDAQGEFTLKLDAEEPMGQFLSEMGTTERIMAVKSGYLPARLDKPTDAMGRPTDWPSTVLLRLPGRPLSLAGTVVDEDGEPLPGMRVWTNETTVFGIAGNGMTTLEGVMADSDDRWNWVRTGDDGRFELTGLTDQQYSLRALDDDTLLMVDSEPVQAGRRDVIIRVPADAYHRVVKGVVVSRAGTPLSGITVIPQGDTFSMRIRGEPISTNHVNGSATRTAADGSFRIDGLPRTAIYLRLQGEDILPLEYGRGVEGGIEALGQVDDLRVEVSLRVHVQVELGDPSSADQIQVLNAKGELLPINVFAGNSRRTTRTLDLVDGRTPVIVVPEEAIRMVFLKGGQPVRPMSLGLIPDEVNRIRW